MPKQPVLFAFLNAAVMILTPLKNFIISICPEKLDKLNRFRHGWAWLLLTALTAGGAFRLWRHWAEPIF